MEILVFIGVLIVISVIVYIATAPKYKVTLVGGVNKFEDTQIEVLFPFSRSENLRSLKQIPIRLINKAPSPISVEWDSCVFVDPSGESRRVIHSGVKLIDRNAPQPASVVASRSKLADVLIPSDNIYYQEGSSAGNTYIPGGWKEHPLLKRWAGREEFSFKAVLAVKADGQMKPYQFEFQAKKAA